MTQISKIMSRDVPVLGKDKTVSDATKLISAKPHSCLVVMDGKKPVGIVAESDIVRNIVYGKVDIKDKVTKIMSSPITSLSPNTKLEKASKIIDTKHFSVYPVIDGEHLMGIVTENSVVQAINENIRFHRNIQNVILILFLLFEFFMFVVYERLAQFFV